jgi:hypothetical protein
MKLEELIEQLTYMKNTYGNLETVIYNSDRGIGKVGTFTVDANMEKELSLIIDMDKKICRRCGYQVMHTTDRDGLCKKCRLDMNKW